MSHWLWVFGEINGLRWVLERGTMAFSERTQRRALDMTSGDLACLYVARGAFHNPTRDIARLGGIVRVTSAPRVAEPATIVGREFSIFVGFEPVRILPEREGPDLRELVAKLERVKRPEVWGHYFRNSPIRLSKGDFGLLERAIRSWKAPSSRGAVREKGDWMPAARPPGRGAGDRLDASRAPDRRSK